MINSVVDVCNMALLFLGSNFINSLNDGSKIANVCKAMYTSIRDEVFLKHEWACLLDRVELTAVESSSQEWGYEYTLPSDLVNVYGVYPESDFIVEGSVLYSNESSLSARYTRKIEDPKKYDILLVYAIVYRLAADIADSVMQIPELEYAMNEEYENILHEAKGRNLEELEGSEVIINNGWKQAGR